MKKALIYGLSAALLLVSLTACHKPQAEQTDQSEPTQAATSEPVQDPAAAPEPPEQSPAPTDQLSDIPPADLDKTEDSQSPEEATPSEAAKETPEQSPKTAAPQTTPTSQQPGSSYGDDLTPEQYAEIERQMWETFEQGGGTIAEGRTEELTPEEEEYIGTILNGGTTQTQTPPQQGSSQQSKDGWDQAFYDTLTPEQKETYKNLPDATYRDMMKQNVEKKRQQEAEGWTTQWGTPTEEQLEEAWSNMTFGQ